MKKALYWEKTDTRTVRCLLCPHQCLIPDQKMGLCRARENISGTLFSLSYGKITSLALDPIEKKPLYHFYPGSFILSLGSFGCNFFCPWCQNYSISQADEKNVALENLSLDTLVRTAKEKKSIGLAYTYNEPLINFEFLMDCARAARENRLQNVLVTNGYINPDPLREILPLIDAANIDIKTFRSETYGAKCSGTLRPVLDTVERFLFSKKHVELTYLVIPSLNDRLEEIGDLIGWVASLSREIPLHFSRYFPAYQYKERSTPDEHLQKFYQAAREKLDYVYLGNFQDEMTSRSSCPHCGSALVKRVGYTVFRENLGDGICRNCEKKVSFIG